MTKAYPVRATSTDMVIAISENVELFRGNDTVWYIVEHLNNQEILYYVEGHWTENVDRVKLLFESVVIEAGIRGGVLIELTYKDGDDSTIHRNSVSIEELPGLLAWEYVSHYNLTKQVNSWLDGVSEEYD